MISISASSAQMTVKEHLSYSSGLKSGTDCREYLILLTVEHSYTQKECSTDNTSVYCSVQDTLAIHKQEEHSCLTNRTCFIH